MDVDVVVPFHNRWGRNKAQISTMSMSFVKSSISTMSCWKEDVQFFLFDCFYCISTTTDNKSELLTLHEIETTHVPKHIMKKNNSNPPVARQKENGPYLLHKLRHSPPPPPPPPRKARKVIKTCLSPILKVALYQSTYFIFHLSYCQNVAPVGQCRHTFSGTQFGFPLCTDTLSFLLDYSTSCSSWAIRCSIFIPTVASFTIPQHSSNKSKRRTNDLLQQSLPAVAGAW